MVLVLNRAKKRLAGLLARLAATAGDAAAQEAPLTLAVDEFRRFESSKQLGSRRALRATQVGGLDLPEGALVTLFVGTARASRPGNAFDGPRNGLRRRNQMFSAVTQRKKVFVRSLFGSYSAEVPKASCRPAAPERATARGWPYRRAARR